LTAVKLLQNKCHAEGLQVKDQVLMGGMKDFPSAAEPDIAPGAALAFVGTYWKCVCGRWTRSSMFKDT